MGDREKRYHTVSFHPELRAVLHVLMASMKGRRRSEMVTVRSYTYG
jgi:hypothetical protein